MIEKVGYSKPVSSTRAAKKTGTVESGAFAEALSKAEGARAAENTAPVAAMNHVNFLGIQEVSDEEMQRRKAFKRGRLSLNALEKLRDGLLAGSLPLSTLRSLERIIAEERALTQDLGLNAILDEIELRAAVEIAKLEVAGLLPPQS